MEQKEKNILKNLKNKITEVVSNVDSSDKDSNDEITDSNPNIKSTIKQSLENIKNKITEVVSNVDSSNKDSNDEITDSNPNIKSTIKQSLENIKNKATEVVSDINPSNINIETVGESLKNIADQTTKTISESKIGESLKVAQENISQVDIFAILDKLLANPQGFRDKILEKIEEYRVEIINKFMPEETDQKIAEKIITEYSELSATSGDLLNMTNIIPGAFFASMPAGLTLFVKFPSELVMSLATLYGLDITNEEHKEICLILFISGVLQEEKTVITPENMETYLKLVNEQLESPNRKEAIRESFNTFGKILARKGIVNFTSASSEFFISKSFAIFLGKQVNNFFINHYNK